MKIIRYISGYKYERPLLKKIILTLSLGLSLGFFSPMAISESFVFPDSVSLERSTLIKSFADSHLLKSVGLRDQPGLASYVKTSILTPKKELKDAVSNVDTDSNVLVLTKVSTDGKHARYSQRFNGYEVFGGEVIAHLNRQGIGLDRVTGNFITGLGAYSIAKKATLNPNQAIENVQKQMDASHPWEFHNTQSELVVYHNPNLQGFKPALAYIVNFLATSKTADPTRPFLVIDAVTGEILDRWEGLNT